MSESKLTMAKKLSNVQLSLMGIDIQEQSLEYLIPLIFKECLKENLTFWFSLLSDACILNLRDIERDNYELNIRHAYESVPVDGDLINAIELNLLFNTFLVMPGKIECEVSSAQQDSNILSGDGMMPQAIRTAIESIQKDGLQVTKKEIMNHLPLGQMSTNHRLACNKYLKTMEVPEE